MKSLERLNKEELLKNLKTKYMGRKIIYLEEVDSTNCLAKKLAVGGIENGTLIAAETQSGGSGRFNRKWHSPAGGLWFTLVLRPKLFPHEAPKITEIAAASMLKVLNVLDVKTEIKWPNDLLLNGKKLCGILAEMKCREQSIDYVVLGIGLNVNLAKDEFDEEIRETATSLKVEFNKDFNKDIILGSFLEIFEQFYTEFEDKKDIAEVVNICRDNSTIFGKQGKLIFGDRCQTVKCVGLSPQGNLIIEDSEENIKEVTSGEISFHN